MTREAASSTLISPTSFNCISLNSPSILRAEGTPSSSQPSPHHLPEPPWIRRPSCRQRHCLPGLDRAFLVLIVPFPADSNELTFDQLPTTLQNQFIGRWPKPLWPSVFQQLQRKCWEATKLDIFYNRRKLIVICSPDVWSLVLNNRSSQIMKTDLNKLV